MKIRLITYGDLRYSIQREFFRESALFSSFFDEVIVFTYEDLEPWYKERFHGIFQFSRGGGYWIWKPYFIKKILESMSDSDVLIYCDSGCMINSAGKERFSEYITQLRASETGILAFEMNLNEYKYTKREVFDHFKSSDAIINSNQLITTAILLKKCKHSLMLIDQWYNTVFEDVWLFTDERTDPQHEKFIDHRHDQSIFSVILKTYGADIIPDETYFLDFIREGTAFPFWAVRLRDGIRNVLYQ